MKKVYVQFPKTGLGNMLLVWARAMVFSELNHTVAVTGPWWGVRWGALLRGEKKNRLYLGYFKESSLRERLTVNIAMRLNGTVYDPVVAPLSTADSTGKRVVVFNKVVTSPDLFITLREHRDFIAGKLYQLLQPAMKLRLDTYPAPVIGVHIRRGDFTLSRQDTPLDYFIKAIACVRQGAGESLPVTIFTDAGRHELEAVLQLPQVEVIDTGADILDMLLLSRSKIMILSRDSTFGYWSAFLSDALVIMRQDDWQTGIRKPNPIHPEVRLNMADRASVKAVQEIVSNFKFTP